MELSIKAPQTPRKSASNDFISQKSQPQTPSRSQQQQPSIHETLAALQQTPLKSIIQSAKKTGLPASPMRVPFALSPMITKNKAQVTPSQPIRDAFLEFPELTSKRAHESEDSDSNNEQLEDIIMGSPSPRKQLRSVNDSSVHATIIEHDFTDLLSDPKDPFQRSPAALMDCQVSKSERQEPPTEQNEQNDSKMTESKSMDEFEVSRELHSHSVHESHSHSHELRFPQNFSNESIEQHQSKSFSSSTSSNPLLPSGIVKLLEKKRQETTSHAPNHNNNHQQQKPPKKKFDLQESLKRPLPYKPHAGPLNKKP